AGPLPRLRHRLAARRGAAWGRVHRGAVAGRPGQFRARAAGACPATEAAQAATTLAAEPLEPTLLPGEAISLDAVRHAQLADRLGQVVAHGTVREVELGGDVSGGVAFAGQAQHLALAVVQ